MSRSARYLIAQHIPDLFRNEPRNVGVVVELHGERTSRFLGESLPGKVDGRQIKHLPYPDVYRQWLEYWNSALAQDSQPLQTILASSGQHYRIVDGGEVADVGDDSIHEVARFLFTSLVDEAGMAKALGGEEADSTTTLLRDDVSSVLKELAILAGDNDDVGQVKHLVHRDAKVRGRTAIHRPAFFQQNGHPVVMETINLSSNRKATIRDHSGWAAFMFGDVKSQENATETIAITRLTPEAATNSDVSYALDMLKATATRIVNWDSESERQNFLDERSKIAEIS